MDWKYWITIASIGIGSYLLSFLLRRLIGVFIKRQSKKVRVDPTNFSFIKNSISFIIFTAAVIIIFSKTPSLNNLSKALFASAGIFAAIVAFASQKAFSNIAGGIFILIFRPFRVNDVIEVESLEKGVVEEITLRHTIIRNYENRRIIIPNTIISEKTITNSSLIDERIKKFVEFDISYESNIDLAKKIITEEAFKHPLFIDVRTKEEIEKDPFDLVIRLVRLGEYSATLRTYIWTKNNDDAFIIHCDLLEGVKKRFENEGIEIPYPHRTIINKKDLLLKD